MENIIENFNEIVINKNLESVSLKENISEKDNLFIKKGYYNGDILNCVNYKIEEKKLVINCCKSKFFDIISNRLKKNPKMVNVNIVINLDGHIILIKRDSKVYSYKNHWDFPAGLVPFDAKLEERIIDRIKEDTKIDEKFLKIEKSPFMVEIKRKSFGLYYNAECSLNKEQIEKFFQEEFGRLKPFLLKKSEIPNFLKMNKRIYPKNILKKLV